MPTPSTASPTMESQEQVVNHTNGDQSVLVAPPSQFSTSDDDTKGLTEDDIDRLLCFLEMSLIFSEDLFNVVKIYLCEYSCKKET